MATLAALSRGAPIAAAPPGPRWLSGDVNHFIGPQRDLEQGSSHAGYSQDHEYIIVEDRVGTVGITNHAQEKLSDVTLVELPHVGEQVKNGGAVGVVESVKAASELYSPVSGEILGVNEVLIGIEADPMWRTLAFIHRSCATNHARRPTCHLG